MMAWLRHSQISTAALLVYFASVIGGAVHHHAAAHGADGDAGAGSVAVQAAPATVNADEHPDGCVVCIAGRTVPITTTFVSLAAGLPLCGRVIILPPAEAIATSPRAAHARAPPLV